MQKVSAPFDPVRCLREVLPNQSVDDPQIFIELLDDYKMIILSSFTVLTTVLIKESCVL